MVCFLFGRYFRFQVFVSPHCAGSRPILQIGLFLWRRRLVLSLFPSVRDVFGLSDRSPAPFPFFGDSTSPMFPPTLVALLSYLYKLQPPSSLSRESSPVRDPICNFPHRRLDSPGGSIRRLGPSVHTVLVSVFAGLSTFLATRGPTLNRRDASPRRPLVVNRTTRSSPTPCLLSSSFPTLGPRNHKLHASFFSHPPPSCSSLSGQIHRIP